jgi:methylenetetrahydrofolate dehydrogenase (NADP+)/methenyltetrahydrofolate cyclohydrolase
LPATVKAILSLVENKVGQWVIVGQGRLVGKPLGEYLEKQNFKVIKCDEFTSDLKAKTLLADVLVVATGKVNLVTRDMVRPGASVIDCGSPKAEVDPAVAEIAGAMTPVPGGVGPMTVVSLLENVVDATV